MRELLFPWWVDILFWICLAGGLIIGEVMTPSFFLIWFSVGCLFAAITSLLGFNEFIQLLMFALSSIGFLIFARPIVKKFIEKDKDPAPSNVYNMIGAKAIVLKPINQINGKVKIMNTGEMWSAYTYEHFDPIEENTQVIIKDVDGAKLVVIPKSAHDAQKE